MMDGRRHSVDIPISKTLVALRRVRSLRDPSTNSMTKLSSLIDNLHWENHSGNGISLHFLDATRVCEFNNNSALRSKDSSTKGQIEQDAADFALNFGLLNSNLKSSGMSCPEGERDDELVFCDTNCQEGLFVRDTFSPHSASLGINQDVDVMDNNDNGCGISCCWSKSPRFRESNIYCEIEDRPLIMHHVDEKDLCGHRSKRHIGGQISPNLETPRSLSMKFRPKSFSDLVGQNLIVRSLLGAISRGRIVSFYLFHGPRGTGKTSASRIFAAALNCLSVEEQKPCGLCRECILFFSGRSKDVKEVDSVRINHADQVKSLLKNACTPPVSSRFKVFIIDECQLLNGETWASLSNSLENLSQQVVFVMITPDLDKLPRNAVSRAQRYHFTKIKDADIARRLEKICAEEGLDFEQAALDVIAVKSFGSVRDAEIMLDQLSLLGKKITNSLVYELTGIVSDNELLDLLDLALSSDTSNTVIRARELMRSRIGPLQLISQLASLIMDILAVKCKDGGSEVGSRFSTRYTSEADMKKLSHALRILSETEKQLRISKNQTTWFTVALLQLSTVDDTNDTKLCLRGAGNRDDDFCNKSPTGQSMKHNAKCQCDNKSYRLGMQEDHDGTLDSIWYKATELCQSSQLKTFLGKKGKLSSLRVDCGLAIAELEFHHRHYVSKAEKSWKLIASSLQFILGCNIELRINYVPCTSDSKYAKLKRTYFSFFSCSRRIQQKSLSSNEQGRESDYADYTSQQPMMNDKTLTSSESYHGREVVTTLRSCEGNLLSSGKKSLNRSCQETLGIISHFGDGSSKEEGCHCAHLVPSTLDSDDKSNCFPQTLWFQKKFSSSYSSKLTFQGIQQQKSIPKCTCSETYTSAY